jgi:hypothetical protein
MFERPFYTWNQNRSRNRNQSRNQNLEQGHGFGSGSDRGKMIRFRRLRFRFRLRFRNTAYLSIRIFSILTEVCRVQLVLANTCCCNMYFTVCPFFTLSIRPQLCQCCGPGIIFFVVGRLWPLFLICIWIRGVHFEGILVAQVHRVYLYMS